MRDTEMKATLFFFLQYMLSLLQPILFVCSRLISGYLDSQGFEHV